MPRLDSAENVMKNAAHHGVKLEVPKDENMVYAEPRHKVTRELRLGIQEHKTDLMRLLLMEQAEEFLKHRWHRDGNPAVLEPHREEIEALRVDNAPMDQYRQAVRDYVMAGILESRRAKQARAE